LIALRYERNPLARIQRVIFEYASLCNLDFAYIHTAAESTLRDVHGDLEGLINATDQVLPMGIRRFDFIGGDVTQYDRHWFDVVAYIHSYDDTTISVTTNGWFLDETDFTATGTSYRTDIEYLQALAGAGVTHLRFTLDGTESRYPQILAGIDKVKSLKMKPRVSLTVTGTQDQAQLISWLATLVDHIYDVDPSTDDRIKLKRLLKDDTNYVNQSGSADNAAGETLLVAGDDNELIECKTFFPPHSSLRIRSNGQVSLCPLQMKKRMANGDLRFIDILNNIQEVYSCRLKDHDQLGEYRKYLDASLFGKNFDHVCRLRSLLRMVADAMEHQQISPDDTSAIRHMNVDIARRTGHLPNE